MIPVVSADEMRAIDAAAIDAGVAVEVLIERAGDAVARQAIDMLGGTYGRTAVVVAGPGNNGADGRVAADRLRRRGVSVSVLDARAMPVSMPDADLVIDAGFGTGFRGEWSPPTLGDTRVLAVDVPTGLGADSGEASPGTWRAERTVTFAAAKPGHLLGSGPGLVGSLVVADIGLDTSVATIGIVEAGDVSTWIPGRRSDAHKWSHAVRIVAGSPGMTGAACLAAGAAMRSGAGMVMVSMPGVSSDVVDIVLPVEAVGRALDRTDWAAQVGDDLDRYRALVVGPGLGRRADDMHQIVELIGTAELPVVVDGDGLFALAAAPDWASLVAARSHATVLTPHDGEFAHLTGHPPGTDRIGDVRRLAAAAGCVVLLKGPTTIVADAGGRVLLVDRGDQRLASAGTGDVLSGIVGALLARRVPADLAAAAGAFVHAEAANGLAPSGLVASDLLDRLGQVIPA